MPFVPDTPTAAPRGFVPDAPQSGFVPDPDPAEGGVPNLEAAKTAYAAYQPPSLGEKLRGGLEAGMNALRGAVAFVPAMAGAAAGFAHAVMHDVNVATTPGSTPDQFSDPGKEAEAGAEFVGGGLQRMLGAGHDSDTGASYTAKMGPTMEAAGMTMGVHGGVPGTGAAVRAAGDVARPPLAAAGEAVRAAPAAAVEKSIKAMLPEPDPEMVKTATMASDKFPDVKIAPDQLHPPGSSGRAAAARGAGSVGWGQHAFDNLKAISRYAVRMVDPENTDGRLTPAALDAGMERAGKDIGAGYTEAGPIDANKLVAKFHPVVESALRTGSDEAGRMISGQVQELLGKADEEGQIPAKALQDWDSRLGHEARSTTDSVLASRMSDLQSVVRDQIEGQLSPAGKAALHDARRRYAYGIELMPVARATGTINSGIITDPKAILRAVTDNRMGKIFTARDKGGDLGDLAKVADMVAPPAEKEGMGGLLHTAVKAAGVAGTAGLAVAAGGVYNKHGPGATRRIIDSKRPAPAPAAEPAPEPPAPLALPYDPNVSPSGGRIDLNPVAVTPEGQAVPPGLETAREDLAVSNRNAGGTGVPVSPEAGIVAPDLETRLGAANYHEPVQPPGPGPLGDLTPDWTLSQGAGGAPPAAGLSPMQGAEVPTPATHGTPPSRAGREIPAAPGRPDLADTMVSGPPGETAVDETTGRAMQTNDAALARREQEAANAPKEPEAPEPPKHPPNAAEQAKIDQIQAAMAKTDSPIVKEALGKAEAAVLKDVKTRHTLEEAKSAAAELRTHAQTITDPGVKQTLLERADKLDPPVKGESNEKPAARPPRLIEARKDAGRGKTGQGTSGGKVVVDIVQGTKQGNAAPDPASQPTPESGRAGQGAGDNGAREDAVIQEVTSARHSVAHPRGPDGRFKPKE